MNSKSIASMCIAAAISSLSLTPALAETPRYFDQATVATLSVPDSPYGMTYYIDGNNGNDSWDGLAASHAVGTNHGPFKTIGFATGPYSGRLIGGTVFKIRGGVYRERLEFRNATGNTDESRRIVVGPYGDGEVVLDTSDSATLSWSPYPGDSRIYQAHCDLTLNSAHVPPNAVILDDNFRSGRPVYKLADVTAFGRWYYDANAKMLYVHTNGDTPAYHNILVTSYDENNSYFGISVTGADYLTLYGLTITGASSYAVNSSSLATKVEQCTIKYSGKSAFKTYGNNPALINSHIYGNVMMNWPRGRTWNYTGGWPAAAAFDNGQNGVVRGNVIHDNGGEGFITGGGNGYSVIEDNIVHDNWSVNLYIETQGRSILRRNLTYSSAANAGDIVSAEDPTVPTWISYAELVPKIQRRLYPVCLATSDESGSSPNSASNRVYDNIAVGCYIGIQHDCEAAGSAMKNYEIANNTVVMPTDPPPAGFTWTGLSLPYCSGLNVGTQVKNNIVVNSRSESFPVFLGGGANEKGIVLDNNLYYNVNTAVQFTSYDYPYNTNYDLNGWQSTIHQDLHSVFADPQFSKSGDPLSAGYYVPTASSPALGMGSALTDFATDFNNFPKPSAWSAGALELGSLYVTPSPTSQESGSGAADVYPPMVTGFSMPALATALTVPVTAVSANDNVGVTGYLITETATPPAADGSAWSSSVPQSFTFAGAGSRTAYAWARDAAGNLSQSMAASVSITLPSGDAVIDPGADYIAVTSDNGAATMASDNQLGQSFMLSNSGNIYSITVVLATSGAGGNAVLRFGTSPNLATSYISEVKVPVSNGNYTPVEFVIPSRNAVQAGTQYYFALTSDANYSGTLYVSRVNTGTYANGNALYGSNWNVGSVDGSRDTLFQVRLSSKATDATAPVVTGFAMPATAQSLTVPITTLAASDSNGVTGYYLSESATAPQAALSGWTGAAPTSFTFGTAGTHTLYAWAKDAAGNISQAATASVNITLPDTIAPEVSISSPASGSSVSGTVYVAVSASDNKEVARVDLYMNGTFKASSSSAPYGFSWNTGSVPNGTYTLTAAAYDAAGNMGRSAEISVTVSNQTRGKKR